MPHRRPTLHTDRLVLRPFAASDAPRVQALAGARAVYETTLNIPHPYEDGVAEHWIASHPVEFEEGRGITLAITLAADGVLVGAIGLAVAKQHRRGELGYWIGVPYWNRGYCTEAARAVIAYGFDALDLHKVTARHVVGNTASERIMIKAGMRKEGELVDEILKDGRFKTLGVYGLVRS